MKKSLPESAALLETACRQTLARFQDEIARGERDPVSESDAYRKRRRDYATLLRMDRVPDEARALAAQLLNSQGIILDGEALAEFERDTTKMLVELYDAFIAEGDQGSR